METSLTSPADQPTRAERRQDAMRYRNRWSTYSRRSAVAETMSRLALAAEHGTNPLDILTLTGQMPIRRFTSLPVVQLIIAITMFGLAVILSVLTPPINFVAIAPLVGIFSILRHNVRLNREPPSVALAESELAHLLSDKMKNGLTLSQAMADLPMIFTPSQIAVVQAGEKGGDLGEGLRQLGRDSEVRQSGGVITIHRQYPIYAFLVLSTIGAFIVSMIIPRMVEIYTQLGIDLPPTLLWILRALTFDIPGLGVLLTSAIFLVVICLCLDQLVRLHAGRVISGLVCMVVALQIFLLADQGYHRGLIGDDGPVLLGFALIIGFFMPRVCDLIRGAWWLLLGFTIRAIPWLRRHFAVMERANFLKSLGMMLKRGVPAAEAIRLAAPTLIPAGLRGAAMGCADAVERGEALELALKRFDIVDPRSYARLRLAIHAGTFPEECNHQSLELAERERIRIAKKERLMRPVVVLAVAAYALGILLLCYVPIFNIATMLMSK